MSQSVSEPEFVKLTDLAAERLGGKVLCFSDEFFAEAENLLKPGRGVFIAEKFTDRGKWMDGWETRRKREPGNDWVIIRLAAPGQIHGFDIDTNHFLGNHPPFASVEGCYFSDEPDQETLLSANWQPLLEKSPLNPGTRHLFSCANREIISHVRLQIYPDGGVARFRVHGVVSKKWEELALGEVVDLAAALNGGQAVLCSDMFFSHMGNLLMPGRGVNMGDGWETKRSRELGHTDWVIVKLGHPGQIERVILDTAHFKGNYPDRCILEGAMLPEEADVSADNIAWTPILGPAKLEADAEHYFDENQIINKGPFSHVKLTIIPDGGVSRMRIFGTIHPAK